MAMWAAAAVTTYGAARQATRRSARPATRQSLRQTRPSRGSPARRP